MIKVIGIGNPLLSDDGFGLAVAEELKKRKKTDKKVEIISLPTPSPWDIYEAMQEGDFFIVIDSFEYGIQGAIEVFPLNNAKPINSLFKTIHDVNINQVLDLLKLQGRDIKGVVVGTKGVQFKLSLNLSDEMQKMVKPAVNKVIEILSDL